jgi:hypothetical protein
VVTPCALALSDSAKRVPQKLISLVSWPYRTINSLRIVKEKN